MAVTLQGEQTKCFPSLNTGWGLGRGSEEIGEDMG